MLKRKSPVKTEGKDRSKITKQEPSRQFMKLSAKPPLPKPEPEFKRGKKKSAKKDQEQGVIYCLLVVVV